MTTISITCTVPAPTLEQVRAWLTREGWMLAKVLPAINGCCRVEVWALPEHDTVIGDGVQLFVGEGSPDWGAYLEQWIARRARQIDSTPESVYRAIMGPPLLAEAEDAIGALRGWLDAESDSGTPCAECDGTGKGDECPACENAVTCTACGGEGRGQP